MRGATTRRSNGVYVPEEQQSRRPPAAGNPKGRAALRPPSVSLVVSDRLRKIASSSLLDGGPNSALRGSRGFYNGLLTTAAPFRVRGRGIPGARTCRLSGHGGAPG